ncbi:MAG: hypothetical protein AAF333_00315 [Planctomycetota bacterium]
MFVNRHILLVGTCVATTLVHPTHADTLTWDGEGADSAITDNLNWVGDVAFANGDDLVFFAAGNTTDLATLNGDASVNSITFNADADTGLTFGTGGTGGDNELTLSNGITINAGSAGAHALDAQLTLATDVVIQNDSLAVFTVNARTQDGAGGPAGVTYRGGVFTLEGARNADSTFTGGVTIENATLQARSIIVDTATRGSLGLGDVTLGETGSGADAVLVIDALASNPISRPLVVSAGSGVRTLAFAPPSSGVRSTTWDGNITLNGDLGIRTAGFDGPFAAVFPFINGTISGAGDLRLFNAPGTDGSLIVLNNPADDSDFVGTTFVDTAVQVRRDNSFGDADNFIVIAANNLEDDGDVIAFISNAAAGGGQTGVAIAQDLEAHGGTFGVGADFNVAAPVAGTFSGDVNLATANDVTVVASASDSTNVAGGTQNLTVNLDGNITGGDAAGTLIFTGGNGAGTVTGTSAVNVRGNNTYAHATQLSLPNAGGTLTVTLDGGSPGGNANLTLDAGTTLNADPTNGGTLNFNISGETSDLITVNGTLDITNLTLDLNAVGPTAASYVVADYSGGTLIGSAFAEVFGLVSGYELDYFTGDQITLNLVGSVLIGDFSGDGFVGQDDLNLVLLNFGATVLPPGFNTGGLDPATSPGGFDGILGQNELDDVLLNFGNGTPPTVNAIPEPGSSVLLAGALGLVGRRRKP